MDIKEEKITNEQSQINKMMESAELKYRQITTMGYAAFGYRPYKIMSLGEWIKQDPSYNREVLLDFAQDNYYNHYNEQDLETSTLIAHPLASMYHRLIPQQLDELYTSLLNQIMKYRTAYHKISRFQTKLDESENREELYYNQMSEALKLYDPRKIRETRDDFISSMSAIIDAARESDEYPKLKELYDEITAVYSKYFDSILAELEGPETTLTFREVLHLSDPVKKIRSEYERFLEMAKKILPEREERQRLIKNAAAFIGDREKEMLIRQTPPTFYPKKRQEVAFESPVDIIAENKRDIEKRDEALNQIYNILEQVQNINLSCLELDYGTIRESLAIRLLGTGESAEKDIFLSTMSYLIRLRISMFKNIENQAHQILGDHTAGREFNDSMDENFVLSICVNELTGYLTRTLKSTYSPIAHFFSQERVFNIPCLPLLSLAISCTALLDGEKVDLSMLEEQLKSALKERSTGEIEYANFQPLIYHVAKNREEVKEQGVGRK